MPDIANLLIANRGEIACRIARTARAMGIATVGVFSDADERALHVRCVDEAIRLPGSTATDTYLRADRIIDAARRVGADAVHPGYGFLSEQASFAQACADAGLIFIGPPPSAIELMGSKIAAKELMSAAGVPTLPSCAADRFDEASREIGFPLLVKAAFGGGGRGMRIVRERAELPEAVAAAGREATAAFGDGTVFLERYIEQPRHIEVQIIADRYGNVAHLLERDCSVQRRHQKLIEEAPAPDLESGTRDAMFRAAVAAARAIGYVNAGTVEFVLDRDGEFFFLEVNTRLQVEHPVTEMITGLDLVALQILIAGGGALPAEVLEVRPHGHAIEARLYAEDASAEYRPASGRIDRLRVPAGPHLRVDAGYEDGSVVSPHYDAMIAKVIAWGSDRADAVRRLARTLHRAEIHGVVTNRELLVGVLDHGDFARGAVDTSFLEQHPPASLIREIDEATIRRHAIEVVHADREERRVTSPVPSGIPSAWRNVGPVDQPETFACGDVQVTVTGTDVGDDDVILNCSIHRVDASIYVDSALGATALRRVDRFPHAVTPELAGSLLAPMPGGITRIVVTVGQRVDVGDPLVAMEAMKMEHTLRAPHAGAVTEIRVEVGDQVEAGSILVVVEADV